MSLLQRIEAWAPVPVFPVVGEGGLAAIERLRLAPALTFVSSIRHASILLVCGDIRADDRPALRRLHDQLPHPRATLWWRSAPLDDAVEPVQETGDDATTALRQLDADLCAGTRATEADWLSDQPPNPWKGEGDHGQGGKGMMGGVPYGRPMAMTDGDLRDGLTLDAMTICIGPFAPMVPPGLSLELTLQGDVIQAAKVLTPAYQDQAPAKTASLWQAASLLELVGLGGLAGRCRNAAPIEEVRRDKLYAAARRAGAFVAIPPGLGKVGTSDVRSRLGEALLGASSSFPDGAPLLVEMLRGLEWQEAMLVIASFSARRLEALAPVTPADEGMAKVSNKQGQHHDHMGHH